MLEAIKSAVLVPSAQSPYSLSRVEAYPCLYRRILCVYQNAGKSMNREKILDRVRKLYAMSQSIESSPNEAEIALRRCQSLMLKFGVTFADLETSEFGSSGIGKQFRAVPSYVTLLSSAVAILHDCICVDSGEIEFRGFSIDAEVASLTYEYLSASMERSLRLRKKEGKVPPGRSASFDYRVGFGVSVLNRCKQIHADRQAAEREAHAKASNDPQYASSLIVVKRELVEENCTGDIQGSKRRTVRYRSGSAHSAGAIDGADVSLDEQLGHANQRETLLDSSQ